MKRPPPDTFDPARVDRFIKRWRTSSASERANAQPFLGELCDALGVERPRPMVGIAAEDTYCFEQAVTFLHPDGHTSPNFIDLYKRAHFVLESKQGSDARRTDDSVLPLKPTQKKGTAVRGTGAYDLAMQRAYVQAERYARALDEWPPFLVVCDVGYCFELYASFDGSGKYRHYPAPGEHRIAIERLVEPDVFSLIFDIFTDPHVRDPSREAAKVTREIASHLAKLAHSLEAEGHAPELVAKFLMRCLFTMFCEDVALLPPASTGQGLFTHAIEHHWVPQPDRFPSEVEALWRAMNAGGAMFGVAGKILQFNGGLFADPVALPMSRNQLQILHRAALSDWAGVEPAIFGTLLERALNPKERHRLGAHFTPRAYVERLVSATIEEPLREDWNLVRAQVRQVVTVSGKIDDAKKLLKDFHKRLVEIRVLDPACGTGNFLYVTLDLFKRIEAEVLSELADLGDTQLLFDVKGVTVNPGQFLGLEVKHWAREIADLVLWIGYLQWHYRTRGKVQPAEPVLKDYKNIECRDALIEWDRIAPVLDDNGQPVTRWDEETYKVSPVTGERVPDESQRVAVVQYMNPSPATWPSAEFVVGNPPFIGNKRMRTALGDGYVEAVRAAHREVPETSDFVMYWWDHAAALTQRGALRRFGLITTNSITQTFNRKVLQRYLAGKPPISISFAVPDHPWVDSVDGAAVRIAMTAGRAGRETGVLAEVVRETESADGDVIVECTTRVGQIHPDLAIGANVSAAAPLEANNGLSFMGVTLVGEGFRLSSDQLRSFGYLETALPETIRPYLIGRDLAQVPEVRFVIDFFGLSEEEARAGYPKLYQWVFDRVKDERQQNKRKTYRDRWWIFGEPRAALRAAVRGLPRYIATGETAKHKFFVFLDASICADHKLYVIASDDAFVLGVLSSRAHGVWALAAGGRLGVGNDPTWTNGTCFLPFPFPVCDTDQRGKIRGLAEQIDAHRKRQQAERPALALTNVYNVLVKLRSGESLTAKEKAVHEEGLVSVLKQLHDELDRAVFEAYGWPATLSDDQILDRLVALNAERADEEQRGIVRWIRPEFQNPTGAVAATQTKLTNTDDAATLAAALPGGGWPKSAPEQLAAVRALFASGKIGLGVDAVCGRFKGSRRDKVLQHLVSLEGLGLLVRYDVAGVAHWHG